MNITRAIGSVGMMLAFCLSGQAALPPLSAEEQYSKSTDIVIGRVTNISEEIKETDYGSDIIFTARVRVLEVLKGKSVQPGDFMEVVYWQAGKRAERWVGDGGQRGDIARGKFSTFFLRAHDDGTFHLLGPNGAEDASKAELVRHLFELDALITEILRMDKEADTVGVLGATRNLRLPEPARWFAEVFGETVGAVLTEEYQKLGEDLEEDAPKMWREINGKMGEMDFTQVIPAVGGDATDQQQKALNQMRKPVRLYTVKAGGMSLWSFVHADGAFRLAGKMKNIDLVVPPALPGEAVGVATTIEGTRTAVETVEKFLALLTSGSEEELTALFPDEKIFDATLGGEKTAELKADNARYQQEARDLRAGIQKQGYRIALVGFLEVAETESASPGEIWNGARVLQPLETMKVTIDYSVAGPGGEPTTMKKKIYLFRMNGQWYMRKPIHPSI